MDDKIVRSEPPSGIVRSVRRRPPLTRFDAALATLSNVRLGCDYSALERISGERYGQGVVRRLVRRAG